MTDTVGSNFVTAYEFTAKFILNYFWLLESVMMSKIDKEYRCIHLIHVHSKTKENP